VVLELALIVSFFSTGDRVIGAPCPIPKVLPAVFPERFKSAQEGQRIRKKRQLLMARVRREIPLEYHKRGGRLIKYLKRWRCIGGHSLVSFGIMPNYIDRGNAFQFWRKNKRRVEFRGEKEAMIAYNKKIGELLEQGTLIESNWEELVWINPTHLVPKPNGDWRLVIDTRKVNHFMKAIPFKMENAITMKDIISKGDYCISFDLKEAYNHVPVHPSMSPLLGIMWQKRYYKFVGMPFGLNDAPRVFSMIMRKVAKAIRIYWNVKVVVYLDDIAILHPDPIRLKEIGKEVSEFLQWLGWTVN
jgi:hypothetical protein